ncbi:hypothetical protein QTP70_011792 [Hemibagrus guttatus]|uniref:Uncharacterized protein n=1 Tax=Hemibagrus guttatus TaxID=175788 RepID=A0AAE0ULV5_9TELE|nr:hypothetical protein QTP70_011792 [Hemibagrus guttatus]
MGTPGCQASTEMKPDGVATTPAEPGEDVVEPVPEVAASEEQVQQDSSPSSSQLEKVENEGEQDGATSAPPLPGKVVNGKISKPKVKTTAPIKTKLSTAGTKATMTGTASRPPTAQSRVGSGVMKTVSNGVSKKPMSMNSEMKKSAPVGVSSQVKKGPAATTVGPRTPVKAAERKAVGSARPVPSTSSGARKTGAAISQALNSKPVTGGSNAAIKPKTTAPRPTAPAAKASVSAAPKATTNPKTTRNENHHYCSGQKTVNYYHYMLYSYKGLQN